MASIKKKVAKNGEVTYWIRACVGRDELGKQVWRTCTLSSPELTPKQEEKEIRRQVDAWEQEQREEFNKTQSKEDRSKISFADFVQGHWWPDHVMNGKHTPSSISFYKYMSDDLVAYFGSKKLNSISAEDIKRYINYLNTEAQTKTGEALSATTVVRHYQTLRNILNYAMRFDYLKEDPCKKLSVHDKPKKDRKNIDFLKPQDAKRFVEALSNEPLYWRCLLYILITTGLRRGEAVGLQWGDLDGDNLTLSIRRNVSIDKNSPNKLHIGKPKTEESVREVPIVYSVYSMLTALKKEQEANFGASLMPSAFIFCNEINPYMPLYPTEPTRHVAKFVKKYNLPNVSPHDLRHTAATLALESGANLKQVQTLLGHKDEATTMQFYAGVTDEAKRRTVEGIESILNG